MGFDRVYPPGTAAEVGIKDLTEDLSKEIGDMMDAYLYRLW